MKKKVQVIIFAVIFFGLSVTAWVTPDKEYSEAERRLLAKLPQISINAVMDGSFEDGFEKYETQTTTEEVTSDFRKGIILALPATYEGHLQNYFHLQMSLHPEMHHP
mgnify:CR=1 FL=1